MSTPRSRAQGHPAAREQERHRADVLSVASRERMIARIVGASPGPRDVRPRFDGRPTTLRRSRTRLRVFARPSRSTIFGGLDAPEQIVARLAPEHLSENALKAAAHTEGSPGGGSMLEKRSYSRGPDSCRRDFWDIQGCPARFQRVPICRGSGARSRSSVDPFTSSRSASPLSDARTPAARSARRASSGLRCRLRETGRAQPRSAPQSRCCRQASSTRAARCCLHDRAKARLSA